MTSIYIKKKRKKIFCALFPLLYSHLYLLYIYIFMLFHFFKTYPTHKTEFKSVRKAYWIMKKKKSLREMQPRSVTHVPSCRANYSVLLLSGEERELRLNETNFERAAALLRQVPEFTIAAALRQDEANSGTIVAFSHGNNRYEIAKFLPTSSAPLPVSPPPSFRPSRRYKTAREFRTRWP